MSTTRLTTVTARRAGNKTRRRYVVVQLHHTPIPIDFNACLATVIFRQRQQKVLLYDIRHADQESQP